MPTALILSGSGRYADPWHHFADTSARLADLATHLGWQVQVAPEVDAALADGLDQTDLLIVNTGDSWRQADEAEAHQPTPGDPELIERARANLAAAFQRGIAVLGLHSAASSLRDYPQFRRALAGEWVPGTSWHPPVGQLQVRPLHDQIVEGLCDFTVTDERYTDLVIDKAAEPLADANGDERRQVVAWAHQYGASRVIYDALGHDTRSYDSRGHKSFLRRALSWLAPRPAYTD
jgi:type 1 glutamine amidotransferase